MKHTLTLAYNQYPRVRDIGYGKTSATWTHPDRCLTFNVFLYIIEGQFQVIEDEHEYILQAGDILFLKSGVRHWGEPKTSSGTSWRWISFFDPPTESLPDKEYAPYQDTSILIQDEYYDYRLELPKQLRVSHPAYFASRMKALLELYQSNTTLHRPLLISLKAAELFAELHEQSRKARSTTRDDILVRKMVELIEQHSREKLLSEALSSALNMNYNYLSGVFKRKMGLNITEFHAMVRINKAIDLLKNPSTHITEVSEALGFSNPYHFSRVFKKVTGISPSQYMHQIYR